MSGSGGETSTAVETSSNGPATGTFTEILSDTSSQSGSGSAAGHYTLSASGSRTASYVQAGTAAAGTYGVTESSTGGYAATTTGYAGVAETTAVKQATFSHTATETVGGTNSFTFVGTGVDTGTTETANGVIGVTDSTGVGTDVYTLSETSTADGGTFPQTVTGTDGYAESHSGNSQGGTSSGTLTGCGEWTSSGSGSTLASGSGTNADTHTTSANELAGKFDQTLTGDTRYHPVQVFADVSNANGGHGHVKFYAHGLMFRDQHKDRFFRFVPDPEHPNRCRNNGCVGEAWVPLNPPAVAFKAIARAHSIANYFAEDVHRENAREPPRHGGRSEAGHAGREVRPKPVYRGGNFVWGQ